VGFGGGVAVAIGTGVCFGVEAGVAVGFGVGVAVTTGVGIGVGAGVAGGFGVGVALGLGVRVGRGEKTAGGVVLEGKGPVGGNVSVVTGREGEGAVTFGRGLTGRSVVAGGELAIVESGTDGFGWDAGVAIGIGVVAGVSAGMSDNVSNGLGRGVAISNGSGEAVSSGLTEALGLAMALAVGFGLGEGEGDGVSTGAEGLRCRKGVEAASCARASAAVMKNTVARTNERMMVIRFFLAELLWRR
jgi:hypothetical protein